MCRFKWSPHRRPNCTSTGRVVKGFYLVRIVAVPPSVPPLELNALYIQSTIIAKPDKTQSLQSAIIYKGMV